MNSTVLFISPDYASHYYPMSAIGSVLARRGNRVVFATGLTLREDVLADGFEHIELALGPGSNGGVVDPGSLDTEEASQLEQFFAASRVGMVETLRHQAQNRRNDLLHEPERVASDIASILSKVKPDSVVADHLAFGATAALRGLDQEYFGFLPGHPSAIPTKEPYGLPPQLPIRIRYDESEVEQLRVLCAEVGRDFTTEYNEAIASTDPDAAPVDNAFGAVSPHGTLVNYPASLGISYGLPLSVRFIGSSVRRSRLTPALTERFREQSEQTEDLCVLRNVLFGTIGSPPQDRHGIPERARRVGNRTRCYGSRSSRAPPRSLDGRRTPPTTGGHRPEQSGDHSRRKQHGHRSSHGRSAPPRRPAVDRPVRCSRRR